MWCKLSDFRPHSSPDPLTRATLPPGEGIFCPYEYRRRMQKNRPHHWERFYVAFSITGTA